MAPSRCQAGRSLRGAARPGTSELTRTFGCRVTERSGSGADRVERAPSPPARRGRTGGRHHAQPRATFTGWRQSELDMAVRAVLARARRQRSHEREEMIAGRKELGHGARPAARGAARAGCAMRSRHCPPGAPSEGFTESRFPTCVPRGRRGRRGNCSAPAPRSQDLRAVLVEGGRRPRRRTPRSEARLRLRAQRDDGGCASVRDPASQCDSWSHCTRLPSSAMLRPTSGR